jgi:cob(I)alamin adenosyltransferase
MSFRIYTRTGDRGETGLFGGGRVPKDNPRVETYGDVDELNSFIGFARSIEPVPAIDDVLAPVQRDLFAIGALLATPDRAKMHEQLAKASLTTDRIGELERAIDSAEEGLAPLKAFILPGGTPKAAALHVARTVCRRAERRIVSLRHHEDVPEIVVTYMNRLSDLLFVLARVAQKHGGAPELTW